MKEVLAPIAELFVYTVAAVGFTAVGVFAEITSIGYLIAGNIPFGIWLSIMGAIALYAGIVALGAGEVLPRVRNAIEA